MPVNVEENQPKNSVKKMTLLQAYSLPYLCTNFSLFVGLPVERIKIPTQIYLKKSQKEILKSILSGGVSNLFRGFVTCALRQNSKFAHRTLIMTTLPQQIDQCNFHWIFSGVAKGFSACFIDTLITSPFENVKVRQMKDDQSIRKAVSTIYRENGFKGFFFGTNISIIKSSPHWCYLFLGYHAVKDKVEKQNFLSTVFWATMMAAPITFFTTPVDVLKTQRQAGLVNKGQSSFKLAKELVSENGLGCLWRGILYRLIHRATSTTAGYMTLKTIAALSQEAEPEETKKFCKS